MNNRLEVIELLKQEKLTLGVVESYTGGLFASSIVGIAGVSEVFKGALVVYDAELKTKLANVSPLFIKEFGTVSGKTALEMAKRGREVLNVDICLAFTGNAGPSVIEDKEKGDVYIALAYRDLEIIEHYHIDKERNIVREDSVIKGWDLLTRVIKQK